MKRTPEANVAITKNLLRRDYGVTWAVADEDMRAMYWVGRHQEKPKLREGCTHSPNRRPSDPDDPNYVWETDTLTGLQLYLSLQPPTGLRLRHLGEIVDGVLRCWRETGSRLHIHPELDCYCIAKYPIVHAATFGFRGITINSDFDVVTVEQLLAMPEVPKKYRRTFETQIQIRRTI